MQFVPLGCFKHKQATLVIGLTKVGKRHLPGRFILPNRPLPADYAALRGHFHG
jgi:hypothetical protein